MNFISRFLRSQRIKAFPSGAEASIAKLTLKERATALIYAVDYCLKLRRDSPDMGTLISMALLDPKNLSREECEALYANLEELCFKMKLARIPEADYKLVLARHGKDFADSYKIRAESSWTLNAIGLAILMTRLSYRMSRLEAKVNQLFTVDSPYSRIGTLLRECLPNVHVAAENYKQIASITSPEDAWGKGTMEFVEGSVRNIASTYPS